VFGFRPLYLSRKGQKKFLESTAIKQHKFWRQIAYWKSALAQAITARMSDSKKPSIASPAAKSEFVLQWCIEAIHKMLSYGVAAKDVTSCMDEVAKSYALSPDQIATAKKFLANYLRSVRSVTVSKVCY
jgi:hypothetical protein